MIDALTGTCVTPIETTLRQLEAFGPEGKTKQICRTGTYAALRTFLLIDDSNRGTETDLDWLTPGLVYSYVHIVRPGPQTVWR